MPLPSFVDIGVLHRRHAALVNRLDALGPAADEGERESLKADITGLFREIEHALIALGTLKHEVKGLAGRWKSLRDGTAPADASARTDAATDDDDDAPIERAEAPAAPTRRATPAAGSTSVRVDHLGASTFVAKGWSHISAGEFDRAEAALRRAVELAPDDAEAGALLGWSLAGLAREDEALVVLQQVLARDPSYALARVQLGWVCLRKGIVGEAIEHLSKCARDDVDRKAALYANFYLGVVYQRREMFDDAVSFFRRALAIGPNLLEAYYEMGRAHWFGGDRDAALDAWRTGARASKFNPWGTRCDELCAHVEQGGEPPAI